MPSFQCRRILVPLDGTAAHEPALPVASTIAGAFSAQLHLILVIPTLETLTGERAVPGMLLPMTMRAILDLAQQGAVDYLEQAVARCRAEGVSVAAEVMRGDAAPAVRDLADHMDADLIIMATHGRAGLDAILTGSVAPRIAGRAPCPLLLVRAEDAADEDH